MKHAVIPLPFSRRTLKPCPCLHFSHVQSGRNLQVPVPTLVTSSVVRAETFSNPLISDPPLRSQPCMHVTTRTPSHFVIMSAPRRGQATPVSHTPSPRRCKCGCTHARPPMHAHIRRGRHHKRNSRVPGQQKREERNTRAHIDISTQNAVLRSIVTILFIKNCSNPSPPFQRARPSLSPEGRSAVCQPL